MVVRLGGIEVAITALLFERDEEKEAATGAKKIAHGFELFGGMEEMFEGVMADDYVSRCRRNRSEVAGPLDGFVVAAGMFGDVVSDAARAAEGEDVPAVPRAVLEYSIGEANVGLDLLGPEVGDPREGQGWN